MKEGSRSLSEVEVSAPKVFVNQALANFATSHEPTTTSQSKVNRLKEVNVG